MLRNLLRKKKVMLRVTNPLVWPFVIGSVALGIGALLYGHWYMVSGVELYDALSDADSKLPEVWGIAAILAPVLFVAYAMFRQAAVGISAAFLGFLVWLYAAWVFIDLGIWVLTVAVAAGNIYFWAWLYLRVHKNHKRS